MDERFPQEHRVDPEALAAQPLAVIGYEEQHGVVESVEIAEPV